MPILGRAHRTVLWLALMTLPAAGADRPRPELDRLRRHVEVLASPDYQGRRGAGGVKAAGYVVDAFRSLGLEPLFPEGYLQEIPGPQQGDVAGRNVGARIVGSDPALRDQWIILSAHFDHLGVRDGVLYPGADDNASGVAMLLEVARAIAQAPERPRRSLMLVAFDLEEDGLFGSRHFVRHPPVPLEQVRLFLTADMIGRSLGGVCDSFVFVVGSEHVPGLRVWITPDPDAQAALRVGLLGTDMVGTRSDYGPFRSRKVPYLFFTTGENPTYHTPRDVPDTLDYPKLAAISRLIHRVVVRAADAAELPAWNDVPDYPFSEAVVVRDVIARLLKARDALEIGAVQVALMTTALRRLDQVIARGSITPSERQAMVRVAQIVIVSVL